jgi:hypothetical protein
LHDRSHVGCGLMARAPLTASAEQAVTCAGPVTLCASASPSMSICPSLGRPRKAQDAHTARATRVLGELGHLAVLATVSRAVLVPCKPLQCWVHRLWNLAVISRHGVSQDSISTGLWAEPRCPDGVRAGHSLSADSGRQRSAILAPILSKAVHTVKLLS